MTFVTIMRRVLPQGRPKIAHRFNGGKTSLPFLSPAGATASPSHPHALPSLTGLLPQNASPPRINPWAIVSRPDGEVRRMGDRPRSESRLEPAERLLVPTRGKTTGLVGEADRSAA